MQRRFHCLSIQDLCSLMDKVNNTSGNDRKKRILKSFVDKWREAHNTLHTSDADTTVCTYCHSLQEIFIDIIIVVTIISTLLR